MSINRLILGVKELNKVMAHELVSRPTYSEEFKNLRDNMQNIVLSNDINETMSNASHYISRKT